jgi:hypothetical protein
MTDLPHSSPAAITGEPKNEEPICAAVVRFIEERRGEQIVLVGSTGQA